MPNRLRTGETDFLLDGHPFQIISGGMHYWRVHPDQWADRIAWARHLGLNTLETYVPWHLHQPEPGTARFDGGLDVRRYLRLIADAGLHAIVRPGPYICAETDFGGLPAWLLREPEVKIRTADPVYLRHVDEWLRQLFPQLVDMQGEPVIAVQVENELGSNGRHPEYLDWLVARFTELGVEVPLFTSDNHEGIADARHPGLLATMNFGAEPKRAWDALRAIQPGGPQMCTEYWLGWFDHWGERHHTRDAAETAALLDEMLSVGASVNLYMFHGGTNFGFSNGANQLHGPYQPTITSYDYDAPLAEGGRPTEKFHRMREVIARHTGAAPGDIPPVPRMLVPRAVPLTSAIGLLDALETLSRPVWATSPVSMERLGQNFGFVCYRLTAELAGTFRLDVPGIRDRGLVLVNGVAGGVLDREHEITSMPLDLPGPGARVDILVENQGRVNYGPDTSDPKGILGEILLGDRPVSGLTMYPLPLDNLDELDFAAGRGLGGGEPECPALYAGRFEVEDPADAYLELPGATKGVVWVNGFNLGRYWDRGPQRRLYLPGPLLRPGTNELRVLELHRLRDPVVLLTDSPDLGS